MRKEIPSLPCYYADTSGKIFFGDTELKYRKCSHRPYLKVTILGKGERMVHRLILETFVSKCPEGMQACHNNGNAQDNRIENLRWDTPKKNSNDRRIHGTSGAGEKNPMAKLTNFQVRLIRECKDLISAKDLSVYFGVATATINDIIKFRIWKNI